MITESEFIEEQTDTSKAEHRHFGKVATAWSCSNSLYLSAECEKSRVQLAAEFVIFNDEVLTARSRGREFPLAARVGLVPFQNLCTGQPIFKPCFSGNLCLVFIVGIH